MTEDSPGLAATAMTAGTPAMMPRRAQLAGMALFAMGFRPVRDAGASQ